MSDAPDPNDLMAVKEYRENQWRVQASAPTPEPEPAGDPATKNLAMQLALQKEPGADMDRLKDLAREFESYLTEHD